MVNGDLPVPGSASWPQLVITPGSAPIDALAVGLASLGGSDAVSTRRSLTTEPVQAHLLVRQRLDATDSSEPPRLVLVIDQFEEIFTLTDASERQMFIDTVVSMVSGGSTPAALVLIGVRGDFIDRCASHPELIPALQRGAFIVGPMSDWEMRQVISAPAADAGLVFDNGLVEDLLADVRDASDGTGLDPAKLPLLSHTLLMLWERRSGHRLTRRAYSAFGGVTEALRSSAEELYSSLDPLQQRLTRSWFRRMIKVDRNGTLSRRAIARSELAGLGDGIMSVVESFTARRLTVVDETSVAIAHDALLLHWDRLRDWIAEKRGSLALYTALAEDAREWAGNGKDASYLYRGRRLTSVEQERWYRWRTDPLQFPPPAATALEFLAAARRQHRRRDRVRRVLTVSLAGMAALVVTAATLVIVSNQRIIDQQAAQISAQLASESRGVALTDGPLAQLLAAAAWEVSETDEARDALVNALHRPALGPIPHGYDFEDLGAIGISGDRGTMAHLGAEGRLMVRDTETWEPRAVTSAYELIPTGLALNEDGSVMLVGYMEGISVIDTASGETLAYVDAMIDQSAGLALSSDESMFAGVVDREAVKIWDFTTFAPIATFSTEVRPTAVAFNRTGDQLVIGDEDGHATVVDLANGHDRAMAVGSDAVTSIAPIPDGSNRLVLCAMECGVLDLADMSYEELTGGLFNAVASHDGEFLAAQTTTGIAVWRSRDLEFLGGFATEGFLVTFEFGRDEYTLIGSLAGALVTWDLRRMRDGGAHDIGHFIQDFDRSADETTLITSSDGSLMIWNVDGSGLAVERELSDLGGGAIALSPQGDIAASVDPEPGTDIVIWETRTGRTLKVLKGHTGFVTVLEFNEDGSQLVSSSSGAIRGFTGTGEPEEMSEIRVWDVGSGQSELVIPLAFRDGPVEMDLRPDGRAVAMVDDSGAVQEWDTRTGELLRELEGGSAEKWGLSYSPDGSTLARGTIDGPLMWNAESTDPARPNLGDHVGSVFEIAFSPDGRLMAMSMGSRTGGFFVTLWDRERQRVAESFNVWPYAGGLEFVPGSRTLVHVTMTAVQVFDLSYLDDPYTAACEQAGRDLTETEWDTYLPSIPYGSIDICDS
jgi:WD40 repeat protein